MGKKGLKSLLNLDPDWKETIHEFKAKFDIAHSMFAVTETTKLHIIFSHIIPFIEHTSTPLAQYSEQELENTHASFNSLWERSYKVINTSSRPTCTHTPQLLRAILDFNSGNI